MMHCLSRSNGAASENRTSRPSEHCFNVQDWIPDLMSPPKLRYLLLKMQTISVTDQQKQSVEQTSLTC